MLPNTIISMGSAADDDRRPLQRRALQSGLATIVRRLAEVCGLQPDLGRALEEALYTLLDVAGGSTAALYLQDAAGKYGLTTHVGIGTGAENFFGHPELLALAMQTDDLLELSSAGQGKELLEALCARSGMLLPLLACGNRLGALLVAFRSTDAFGNDEIELGRTVGIQIAQTIALNDALATQASSRRKYRALFQGANDVIALLTPEGVILDANRRCEELLQVPREQLIGRHVRDFAAPGQEQHNDHEFSRATKADAIQVVQIKRTDGSTRHVEFSSAPIDLDGDQRVFSIGRDVTERVMVAQQQKHVEQQLLQVQKMEAIGLLTGGIAHDFNNILAAIMANSYYLMESLEANDPRRADAEEIQKCSERATSLTRQLLAFSRRQILEPTIVDLNVVVRDLDKMLRRLIGEHIEVSILAAADLGSVRVDVGQIEQVIMNLAVNSRDAMPAGGKLTIETCNVVLDDAYAPSRAPAPSGSYVMLTITDTGCGMDAETQRRAFEPFFTTKEKGRGTGLGLSTTHGIVHQSGGYISLYSEPGRGSVFKLYFPRVDEQPDAVRRARSDRPELRGTETILLLEDDDALRAAVNRALSECGYQVLVARDGHEARAIFKGYDGAIALVLSDVVMPGTSGPEIVNEIRARCATTKVIFMSGYTDHAMFHDGALPAGMNFLQKPFTPAAVAKKVREVLDA